ncbi:MAG: hypothetical protein ACREA5_00625 [Nitrosotalea sp.]
MTKDKSEVKIRGVTLEDVPKIIELQKKSFPHMAAERMNCIVMCFQRKYTLNWL